MPRSLNRRRPKSGAGSLWPSSQTETPSDESLPPRPFRWEDSWRGLADAKVDAEEELEALSL